MQNRKKLALIIILALCIIVPTASAKRKTLVEVYTVPAFVWGETFEFDIQNEPMPNGFTKVDMKLNFKWLSEPFNPSEPDANIIGTAVQHVVGIRRTNGVESLHGTGVYTSTVSGKQGTITYTIGNIWKPNDPFDYGDDEYWGAHLKISSGTEYFDGLKGQGDLNFEEFAFELYLDYNPWEP